MPVTFDGPNKLILATAGTTSLLVGRDIYSPWKVWVATSNNAKYLPAFRVVGGDPTVGGNFIAGYFFLQNGWKLRPQEANHTLVIGGTLLVEGGGDPFVSTIGTYNVRITSTVPLQAEAIIVETGVSGLTAPESAKLLSLSDGLTTASAVWSAPVGTPTVGTTGELLRLANQNAANAFAVSV